MDILALRDAANDLKRDVHKLQIACELLCDCYVGTKEETRERRNVVLSLFCDILDLTVSHADDLKKINTDQYISPFLPAN